TSYAGAGAFNVFVGSTRWHGHRQRVLGGAGDKNRRAKYNALFRNNADAGAGDRAALSANRARAGTGASGCSGLILRASQLTNLGEMTCVAGNCWGLLLCLGVVSSRRDRCRLRRRQKHPETRLTQSCPSWSVNLSAPLPPCRKINIRSLPVMASSRVC